MLYLSPSCVAPWNPWILAWIFHELRVLWGSSQYRGHCIFCRHWAFWHRRHVLYSYSILPVSNSEVPWDYAFQHLLEVFCPGDVQLHRRKTCRCHSGGVQSGAKNIKKPMRHSFAERIYQQLVGLIKRSAPAWCSSQKALDSCFFVKWCLIYLMPDFTYSNFDCFIVLQQSRIFSSHFLESTRVCERFASRWTIC